jgi:deoxyribodipyrimidine photo-lyase
MIEKLPTQFATREQMRAHLCALSPHLATQDISQTKGGRDAGEQRLKQLDALAYGRSRNFLDGAVSYLSPYIRHGIVTLNEARNLALQQGDPKEVEKFVQELGWRDFWQRIYAQSPEKIWHDIEAYKTGYGADHYSDQLPEDIEQACTPSAAMNYFIQQLQTTGYLHNHARMYLAAYLVHWRHVAWQTGAKFFLEHLLDGDPASNNLSFQWVASTFANKPYFFNLENLQRFAGSVAPCSAEANPEFDASYEALAASLFPYNEDLHG